MQPPELFPGSQAGEVSWVSYPQVPIYHPPAEASPSQCQDPPPCPSSFARHPTLPRVPLLSCFQKLFQKLEVSALPQVKGRELCHLPGIRGEGCHPSLLLTSKPRERARFISHAVLRHCPPLSLHVEAEFYSVPSLRKSDMKSTLAMLPSERAWHESLSV